MSSLTVEEAQAHLSELINNLKPGDEVVITDHDQPVARLVATEQRPQTPRRPGTLRGTVKYMCSTHMHLSMLGDCRDLALQACRLLIISSVSTPASPRTSRSLPPSRS